MHGFVRHSVSFPYQSALFGYHLRLVELDVDRAFIEFSSYGIYGNVIDIVPRNESVMFNPYAMVVKNGCRASA